MQNRRNTQQKSFIRLWMARQRCGHLLSSPNGRHNTRNNDTQHNDIQHRDAALHSNIIVYNPAH